MNHRLNNLAGFYAEEAVAAQLERDGKEVLARRWRSPHGEIDLILRESDGFAFVEVKKSRTHAAAAARVTRRQQKRILLSALEFMASNTDNSRPNMRFDVATVDVSGRVECIQNAFGEH